MALGKNFKKIKKIFAECRPSWALGKEIMKKIKKTLPSASLVGRSAKYFFKKIKKIFAECL